MGEQGSGLAYKSTLFDGQKNLSLTDPAMWSGIAGFEHLSGSTDISTTKAWSSVGYVARCVDLRANGVAGLPWTVSRGEETTASNEDATPYPWLSNLTDLLYLTEAALAIGWDGRGQAYWYQVRNRTKKPLSLRWFAPDTMTPVWDARDGLIRFERRVDNKVFQYPVEDVPYFAMPNPMHETEPGPSPVATALADVSVVYNLNEFASAFFDRGAIKATILTMEGGIPGEAQKEQLKSAWARAMQGLKNAFNVEVFNSAVKPVTIGDGIGDLDNTALTTEKREAISTALGVPHSLVMSNASNFATAEADRLNFYDQTIKPSALRIQSVLNQSIFEPMGLAFRFAPETLPIYQEDEEQRAQSFSMYVGAGILPSIAAEMLGLTLPEGIEYADLDPNTGDGETALTVGQSDKGADILGYHIESGVVTRNEARAELGLPPVDESEDQALGEVRTKLDLMIAARNAGLDTQTAAALIGFDIPQQTITVVASEPQQIEADDDDEDEPPAQRSAQWRKEAGQFRAWYKRRIDEGKRPLSTEFTAEYLSQADKATIAIELTEDSAAADAPFPVMEWASYP
jgi:HK97 family phage portal protein